MQGIPEVYTAIFVWIDGFSFSALTGSKIFGKIPRISIDCGKDFAEDFPFWMRFLLVRIIYRTIFLWDPIVQNEIRQFKRKSPYYLVYSTTSGFRVRVRGGNRAHTPAKTVR